METDSIILKRDAQGRTRVPAQQRELIVAEYQRSGLTPSAFAKFVGMSKNTLWSWLHARGLTRKRSRRSADASSATASAATAANNKPIRFLQLSAPASEPAADVLRVRLPGGAVMELGDAAHLELAARLIQTLA